MGESKAICRFQIFDLLELQLQMIALLGLTMNFVLPALCEHQSTCDLPARYGHSQALFKTGKARQINEAQQEIQAGGDKPTPCIEAA